MADESCKHSKPRWRAGLTHIWHLVFFPENVVQTFYLCANVLVKETCFSIHYICKDFFVISGAGITALFLTKNVPECISCTDVICFL